MTDRDKLPTKTITGHVAQATERSGSLVARGLADIEKKQTRLPVSRLERAEKFFLDAADAWKRGDFKETVKWATMAADWGNPRAAELLGAIYSLGEPATRNYVQAHMWYSVAAQSLRGIDYTWMYDDVIASRNWVARMLSPAQVAEAEKLARDYLVWLKRRIARYRLALADIFDRAAERNQHKAQELRRFANIQRLAAHVAEKGTRPKRFVEMASEAAADE